jgi:hypothetical protein
MLSRMLGFTVQGAGGKQAATDAAMQGIPLAVVALPEPKRDVVLLPRRCLLHCKRPERRLTPLRIPAAPKLHGASTRFR